MNAGGPGQGTGRGPDQEIVETEGGPGQGIAGTGGGQGHEVMTEDLEAATGESKYRTDWDTEE